MPSLKGLACVSLFTLFVVTPAFAQSSDMAAPASRVPTISTNTDTAPGNQQSSPKVRKHRRRSRNPTATQQSQPGNPQ